jgi:lipopolysaccharide export system permease protein
MISIIWRFLIAQYLKVMALCLTAFIAILLTTRLGEIAHFASLDPSEGAIFFFVLYQIPYMLPIAFPIACLISSILLVQRLSRTHELTALRACGMSLREVLMPLLTVSAFTCVGSFYVVSELATHSHLLSSLMKMEVRSINPLLLLHNKHLLRIKGAYFDTLGPSQMGESASDVVIAMPNRSTGRLTLLIAKQLKALPETFVGQNLTLISFVASDTSNSFDTCILENTREATTSAKNFSQLIQHKAWEIHNDYLQMSLLLAQLNAHKAAFVGAKNKGLSLSEQKTFVRTINRDYSEIMRRLSVALAPFTFTFMGLAFGINISRRRSFRSLFTVIGLAALFISAYYAAKGLDHLILVSSLFYIIPHVIILILSIQVLNKISKGIG